jgi:hypothetical protein
MGNLILFVLPAGWSKEEMLPVAGTQQPAP